MTSFADRAGTWAGQNSFRLLATDEPRPAPASAVLGVQGPLTTLAYAWEHPTDGDQAGSLTVGPGPDDGSAVALWGDSWHQAPEAKVLTGHRDGASVTVGYDYAPGQWRWEITLTATDDGLELRMDNVPLEGDEERYAAMAARLHRT
ncbi:hypothetical protein [Kineococcus rhizosphaerae]|uniref:DUF1579 domain-containing protein n=1 Tax=Kineococcus rhizosphaerae TaxID=559628 RepID=A0A2T0RBJ7_9ACTN|nr:hypothetical protein [Kineococcus rhizosphaerae]PRY18517.1 hypothetical protein CLV37_101762 [Kineococcus rhizosphaerae]